MVFDTLLTTARNLAIVAMVNSNWPCLFMGIQFLNINLDAIDESYEYKRMLADVANIALQVDVSFEKNKSVLIP